MEPRPLPMLEEFILYNNVDGWGYLWSHEDNFGASVTRKTEAEGK